MAKSSEFVLVGDDVAVRVDFGIAENRCEPILEPFGDEMLQSLGFFVDFVPGVLQNVVEE